MKRTTRRPRLLPNVEALEVRSLPSAGGLLVRFADGTSSRAARLAVRNLGGTIVESFEQGPTVVELAQGVDPSRALALLRRTPGVLYAERNALLRSDAVSFNDARLAEAWGLNSPNDADINAPEAWTITTGTPSTIVAVIDSGFDLNHPDLFNKVWVNPREIPGNGIDEDANGRIDDVFGWNFVNNSPDIRDHDGHGTHVSGTIAAIAGNGIGIAGVAPGVRIMPLKFIGPGGDGSISDAVSAIYYAVANGAKVINASWGSNDYSQALTDAVRFAGSRNVVFVTAAGNEAVNNDRIPTYPPNIVSPNVLSVAAVDSTGNLASFSNFGPRTVDVAAPGVNIVSTVAGGGYARYSGTSMATPHVAGIAALLFSQFPGRSAEQVVRAIVSAAKPRPGLAGRLVSGGIADAYRALTGAAAPASPSPGAPSASPVAVVAQGAVLSHDDARSIVLGSDAYYRRTGGKRLGFLRALSRELLGKRLDRATQARWQRQLRRGASRQQLARSILAMPQAQRIKVANWLLNDLGGTASAASLASRPDVAGWASLLSAGWADADVRSAILGSPEYAATAGPSPESLVGSLYLDLLGRPADPGELADGLAQLGSGATAQQLARAILATLEARQADVARWYQRDFGRTGPFEDVKADPEVRSLAEQIRV